MFASFHHMGFVYYLQVQSWAICILNVKYIKWVSVFSAMEFLYILCYEDWQRCTAENVVEIRKQRLLRIRWCFKHRAPRGGVKPREIVIAFLKFCNRTLRELWDPICAWKNRAFNFLQKHGCAFKFCLESQLRLEKLFRTRCAIKFLFRVF